MKTQANIWVNNTFVLTADAFSEMVASHYPIMFNFGLTVCDDKDLVKDTIQDLFLGIWEKRNEFNIQFTKSYLLKSLRNNLIAALNKQKKKNITFEDIKSESSNWEDAIDTLIIANQTEEESLAQLKNVINGLSKKNKEVVFLKYYQGFSNEEVAEILSINKQSVANTVHRILSIIRKNLPTNYAALSILLKVWQTS